MSQAADFIKAGRLDEARALLLAGVKARPTDVAQRFELAELMLLQGDWEKADTQFDLVSTQDPSFGVLVALIRQLIRAEIARREVFADGRTPELLGDATPEIEASLRILLALRNGEEAGPIREAADDLQTPPLVGDLNGDRFEGLRDLDDRVAGVLELLTSTGKYYWVPWERVRSMELRAPERLRDLVWREAEVDVVDGPNGVVYIPCNYVAAGAEETPETRLGRETVWVEDHGVVRGVGQRCLLVGEEMTALSDFTELLVAEPVTS